MGTRFKDKVINAMLILFFLGAMAGSAYFIIKAMTRWNVKGLG